jgi:hypothetical protein
MSKYPNITKPEQRSRVAGGMVLLLVLLLTTVMMPLALFCSRTSPNGFLMEML